MTLQTKVYRTKLVNILLLATTLLCLLNSVQTWASDDWQPLAKGIEYQDIASNPLKPWSHIHVFRIDPRQQQFSLVFADNFSQKNASISEYAHYSKPLLALNGGFFDPEYNPLGLRITNHQQKSPLKRISWWGIFYIQNDRPAVTNVKHFRKSSSISFAVQSGPRLLIQGRIPSLKPGSAERSALGVTKDNKIIILVTENASMTTTQLAQHLKAPPLLCKDALNLDGGNSSQLFANINHFKLNVHGFSNVSDAIIVKEK